MFHPKKLVAILSLSTLFLTPFVPPMQFAGSDTAFAAKGGNGGGNGNGKGNSGTAGTDSGTAPSGKSAPSKAKPAKADASASSLGSMNGALHASPKAVLAHIRNGETSGPIGALAAYLVAAGKAANIDPAALAEQQQAYDDWTAAYQDALDQSGYADAAAYLAAKQANLALQTQYQLDLAAYQASLETDSPLPAPEAPPEFTEYPVLESTPPTPPSPEDVAALQSLTDAQLALLAQWNKNPDSDPATISQAEADLLARLQARFTPEQLAAFLAAAN